MAIRPMKRKSSKAAGARAAKKMKQQSQQVAGALKAANLPDETKTMLVGAVRHCLATFADQRHQYQAEIVQMAGASLAGVENALVAAVAAEKQNVDSFDHRRMEMAIPQAAHRLAALRGAAAEKEADIVAAEMEFQQVHDVLKAALKQQKKGDAEYTSLAADIEDFNQLKSQLEQAKEEVPSKSAITKLSKQLKGSGVEEMLADSLHGVLAKPSSERSEFDTMTLGQLNDKLAAKTQEMGASLAQLEPGKAERAAAVAAAQGTHDAAKAKLDNAKAASQEAEKAVKDGEAAFKKTESDLDGFAKHLKKAEDGLKEAEKKLADFRSGPLETFRHLESCNAPVPEPEAAPEPAATA